MVRRQMWYHCFSIIYSSVIILTLCNVNVVQAPHIYFRFIWLLMLLFIILHIVDRFLHYYTPNRPFSRYLVNITQTKNSVTDSLFKAKGFIFTIKYI